MWRVDKPSIFWYRHWFLENDVLIHPTLARTVKNEIDKQFPTWRGMTDVRMGERTLPRIILIDLDALGLGGLVAVASGSSNEIFGAGHLTINEWWRPGGQGAVLKGGYDVLDAMNVGRVLGYIHVNRLGFSAMTGGGVSGAVQSFFNQNRGEYSAFVKVEFVRDGGERFPWRAKTRA